MRKLQEKMAIYKPKREASEGNNLPDSRILNFQLPGIQENKFLFNPPKLWYFVVAALANEYKC